MIRYMPGACVYVSIFIFAYYEKREGFSKPSLSVCSMKVPS
ncbi:hypothetical protein CHCC20335_2549 [Bacillus paralicheniformis]|nr:hypothetical protein CHCC20335_2549 [Bacillus paralicheniformis]